MAGKYTSLEHYLQNLPANQKEATVSFEEIERILNDRLPPSAFQYQAWWRPEGDPHQPEKQAIANAGWKVDKVNFPEKWVRLVRSI